MSAVNLPIALPEGWSAEADKSLGSVIISGLLNGHKGFVTVSEPLRAFALGMSPVRRQSTHYSGRYWRKELYEAAIVALKDALA